MKLQEWLLSGDPSVARLTRKALFTEESMYTEAGWIARFLECYDVETKTWGQGIYGPKWVSTFYTMRDLFSLEIDPRQPTYQQGLDTLLQNMWNPETFVEDDLCVIAMFIGLLVYGKRPEAIINDMVDYVMSHQQPDGGWNCSSLRSNSHKGSIHTTLSVLEAFAEYEKQGYIDRLDAIKCQTILGQEYLLRKHLLRRETDHSVIMPYITSFHFPTRWKFDVLRVLVYFASISFPYDSRMEEAITLLKSKFDKGYLTKGPTYSGKIHFAMEESRAGRMNTLRGLMVLKQYDPAFYRQLLTREVLGLKTES